MPRNGDIRSFFGTAPTPRRPAVRAPSSPTPARAPAAAAPAPAAPPSPLDTRPRRSPMTRACAPPSPPPAAKASSPPPAARPRQVFARDAVIAASDDEDGSDSDDDLDLPEIFGPRAPAAPAVGRDPCVTPRAKRVATEQAFFSSPLTIQSKKKKYDMAALLKLNESSEEARASARRFEALMEDEKRARERRNGADGAAQTAAENQDGRADATGAGAGDEDDEGKAAHQLKQQMLESAATTAVNDGEEGVDKMRIVRALGRANVSGGGRAYYFFEQKEPEGQALLVGNPFPDQQAEGVWEILADKRDRSRHFTSGFPFDLQKMFGNMPDEIFLWVLNEVCYERRRDLSLDYVKLLRICDDQVRRLVTPELLQQLFRKLGATKDVEDLSSSVTLRNEVADPYRGRSWVCLESFLGLLECIATSLSPAARTTTMQILLRLGMDRIAVENFGLAQEWRWAVDITARSVLGSGWTTFVRVTPSGDPHPNIQLTNFQCREVCASVHLSTEKAILRHRAIALLGPMNQPESPPDLQRRTLDLKRRLATAFFFNDPSLVDQRPEDIVTLKGVMSRIEGKEFNTINAETDYRELTARVMLLNIALGDASRHQVAHAPDESRDFDEQVDKLAEALKTMLTRVAPQNKGIHVSRIEAKSAMEMVRERLLYQVRSKKKPKILGIRLDEPEEDTSLPKQQHFLEGFLAKKDRARPSIETEMVA